MARIRVVLVEDNRQFLEEVSELLTDVSLIEVTGRYTTGKDAIRGIVSQRPDVALIDLGLPDLAGAEVIRTIRGKGCKTQCLALTVYDDDAHLFAALQAGAVGYLVKDEASRGELVRAIEEVRSGGAPMSPGIARRILQEFRRAIRPGANAQLQSLTKREQEVLEYRAKGFSTRKVAQMLYISYETVRSHHKAIYDKLQVHSIAEAVALWRGDNI